MAKAEPFQQRSGPAPAPASHPAAGLASLAAVIASTAVLLWGVPALFGILLSNPAIAEMPGALLETAFTLATFAPMGLLALAAIRLWRLPVPIGRAPALFAGTGLAMGVVGFALSLALCAIAGTANEGPAAPQGMGLLLLEAALVLLQSGAEELTFRGFLQADLARRWGHTPAVIIAAVTFAMLHFVVAASEPMSFVTMLMGGLLFGFAYARSGSFLMAWMIHFGWNSAEELLFGLYPNPGSGTFGALINIDLRGTGLWGGGPEGLNASISSVVVLAALLVVTIIWPSAEPAKSR
ncbi:type II CAAX endopeptidase family protein [Novosphingobium sp.]|uniref:CPBP family intramembrane glutamic endopeptidase n=1 Tax=Novosphingobium sp. TaxID=1874826 RepID=UPI001D5475D4|nr:type II CAAX endopeptidase family protein [Novosphingobium sp.]MBX9662972.1 CPBP family intramembrane metalloprotease [Novosphingobium sp.]